MKCEIYTRIHFSPRAFKHQSFRLKIFAGWLLIILVGSIHTPQFTLNYTETELTLTQLLIVNRTGARLAASNMSSIGLYD